MFELRTEIDIEAPRQRVWNALTDFARFPEWNPFVLAVEGEPAKGVRLKVTLRTSPGGEMTFRPLVLAAEPERELRWRGRLLMPGLFDGEHYFQLSDASPGLTRLIHGERFSGLLVPWLRLSLERDTRQGFVAMNRAVKRRLEKAFSYA
jgi:hypothetical protein